MKYLRLVEKKEIRKGFGYVFRTFDGRPVLSTSNFLEDSFEKQNKWKIGVSLSTGCDVGCIYCFTRNLDFYRPLSVEEIVEQASFVYDQNNFSDKQIDEVKIEMKEMGDPALNVDGVCGAIRILNDKFLNLLYVVSSSGVKNYSLFEELKKVRDEDIEIRLQFSCHTTDNEQRRILSPRLDMFSLEEISEVVENWYDENQKVTLNFVPFKKFEDHYLVREAFYKLKEKCQEVIYYRRVMELSVKDIKKKMDLLMLSEDAIRHQISYCLKQLRKFYFDIVGDEKND